MPDLRRPYHFVLAILAAFVLLVAGSSSAQISPGPLACPHQFLNGATNCTTCHKLAAGKATFRCSECHTEIASRIAAHKGLHATYNIKPGSSQECVRCHSDHNGEDFPLVKWDTKTFDHKQTGYVLEGKHAGLACNKCHSADKISPSERAAIKVKDLNKTFLALSTNCVSCHQDEHKGRLGPNCTQCHNFEDWKTVKVEQFDHSKTRYPLTGLHAQVKCEKSHTPGPDNKPRYAGIPFNLCTDCHSDPHKGSFVQRCESCHTTGGWKRVSLPGVNEKFDHSKTKYLYDVVIVGAGPGGISVSLRAIEKKVHYITIERDEVGGTVAKYPRQKLVMTSPVEFPMYGKFKKTELSKENLLAFWDMVLNRSDFNVSTGEKVEDIRKGEDGIFTVKSANNQYRGRAVILAMGKAGEPRKLGVPGEDLPKVMYRLIEADHYVHKKILVIGGGDSAVEAAMGLAHQIGNEVTLSYRSDKFSRIKERNRTRVDESIRSGKIKVLFKFESTRV